MPLLVDFMIEDICQTVGHYPITLKPNPTKNLLDEQAWHQFLTLFTMVKTS